MRVQTAFEKMSQATLQNTFAVCFVILRILAGLALIYAAVQLLHMTGADVSTAAPGSTSYNMQVADLQAWKALLAPVLFIVGGLFTFGLFVRPMSVLVAVLVIYNAATSGSINPGAVWLSHLVIALGLCMFAVGGSSHVAGLDGIISRNIRRPNAFTKFLFG